MTTATSLHSSSHPRPKTLGELRRVPDFDARSLQRSVKDEMRANLLRAIERNRGFAPGPTLVAAQPIECSRADRGVKQRAICDGMLSPPKTNKGFLHDVLGLGPGIRPASGKKEERRPELSKTGLPIIFGMHALHAVFTIF